MAQEQNSYVARYWEKLDNGDIVCYLCPRACRLKEGQRGFCFVRQNIGQQLILTTYGRSSGFCVDPIEKKPLNHFYPQTTILSFGTAGCNLGCQFCQNWDLSRSRSFDRMSEYASADDVVIRARSAGCKSVAFTYNDPVIFAEYAIDIAEACHKQDIKTVAVTAGYISDRARPDFFQVMDAANVDLKAFSESFYRKYCQGALQPVLDTLLYLKKETRVWFEITTLLIPGLNDSDRELDQMTDWILEHLGADVPLHLTAFHPAYRVLNIPATSYETLSRARQLARDKGLHYVYTGNVLDPEGSSTYCHACGKLLIKREWFHISANHIVDGHNCAYCGAECAGIF